MMRTAALILLLGVLVPAATRAQGINLGALDAEPNRVHVTTGAEYGFVAGAGYSRVILDRRLVVTGDVTVPWASFDLSDYKLRAGALAPIVGPRRWKLAGFVAAIARGNKNYISRMIDAGVDLGVVGGYYAGRWFAAGELGFDWAMATHVAHTDEYRAISYMDAKDGWYTGPGGNLRAGIQGGVALGRYDVVLRAGQVRDVAGEPPLLPFYGTLSVDARW